MRPAFDLRTCLSKLAHHYNKTATVPTSVWSKKTIVDIHQIYTRLSWVKEEQTPAGTMQSELKHYSDLFTANKNGVTPKRIIVQGETGIGKSTFVKKLLVDWVEVYEGTGNEQTSALRNFELAVAVNLKEFSKCQNLSDFIRLSNVFSKEENYMTEGLVDYITNNQEKVLLILDGYDEHPSGRDSYIYDIFCGNSLKRCCVLITTRNSKADELKGSEDLCAEITGFSEEDRRDFMRRLLSNNEMLELDRGLRKRNLVEFTRFPLFLLFFCLLYKEKRFPSTKTDLFTCIIQSMLVHRHGKQAPLEDVEITSFKETLVEIGNVALQSLLKGDLFECNQLSDSVRCDESFSIGLHKVTKYSESIQPLVKVSFIHKSIQEYLAGLFLVHSMREGRNLDEFGVKPDECSALDTVFQFVCGLWKESGLTALSHSMSLRTTDPPQKLSYSRPGPEQETDTPQNAVNEIWRKLYSFGDAESKSDFSRTSFEFDCLGGSYFFQDHFLMTFRSRQKVRSLPRIY